MEKSHVIAALAALAQDNRLETYRLLVQAGPTGMPAGQVAAALGLPPNTLSFHFDRLRQAVHVSVGDLSNAIGFYSTLFAARPSVVKPDYAKWMLDDPRVNFAISMRGRAPGLNHLGIQAEDAAELQEIYGRLRQADRPILEV